MSQCHPEGTSAKKFCAFVESLSRFRILPPEHHQQPFSPDFLQECLSPKSFLLHLTFFCFVFLNNSDNTADGDVTNQFVQACFALLFLRQAFRTFIPRLEMSTLTFAKSKRRFEMSKTTVFLSIISIPVMCYHFCSFADVATELLIAGTVILLRKSLIHISDVMLVKFEISTIGFGRVIIADGRFSHRNHQSQDGLSSEWGVTDIINSHDRKCN